MTAPTVDHAARRDRVRDSLAEHEVDALLVTHLVDVRWLAGLVSSNAAVLLRADGDDLLMTDGRYAQAARDPGIELAVVSSWTSVLEEAGDLGALGFQAEHVTVRDHEGLVEAVGDPVPTTGVLATARRRKDEVELAAIARACELTDAGWEWVLANARPGLSERDLARGLVRHLEDLGADGPAFPPIVASGPNSAVPHHRPTDRPLGHGELLKVDFGAMVDGYCSDCTRTLALGDPGERLRELHAAVRVAQAAGVEAAVVGASCEQVHDVSVGALAELDLGPTIHGVGHGLGLEIHEAPILSSEPTATLADGFVITVEPGIYLAGVGGVRIEDTVAVTSDGPRRLTKSPRDLVVL